MPASLEAGDDNNIIADFSDRANGNVAPAGFARWRMEPGARIPRLRPLTYRRLTAAGGLYRRIRHRGGGNDCSYQPRNDKVSNREFNLLTNMAGSSNCPPSLSIA